MQDQLQEQILGAREEANAGQTLGTALANNAVVETTNDNGATTAAVNTTSADFTAGKAAGQKQGYCFIHGHCGHNSLACSQMAEHYQPYAPTSPHAEKYHCITGGQNVGGVLSSNKGASYSAPAAGGGRGTGSGGGRGNGRYRGRGNQGAGRAGRGEGN